MRQLRGFILFPKAPLHVSARGTEDHTHPEETIASDTLASALVCALAELHELGDSEDVKTFLNDIALSSAFPCICQMKETSETSVCIQKIWPFYPLPKGTVLSRDLRIRKEVKQIRWIERHLLAELLTGRKKEWKVIRMASSDCEKEPGNGRGKIVYIRTPFAWLQYESDGTCLAKYITLFGEQEQARVQVPRVPGEAHPFHLVGRTFGALRDDKGIWQAGLFFIACGVKERLEQIRKALEHLQDTGLGADRTVGLGHFQFVWWDADNVMQLLPPINLHTHRENAFYSLGMFCPDEKEFKTWEPLRYELVLRGGWITLPGFLNVRRKGIYMFDAGSLFRSRDSTATSSEKSPRGLPQIAGGVHDVRPNEPASIPRIYRSGRTLFLPCISS